MRLLAVDPRTTRALVAEHDDAPARLWLVTPLWARPVRGLEGVLALRAGWICDLYAGVASFDDARRRAREAVAGYEEHVARFPDAARRDDVGPFRASISPRRSIISFLARRERQARIDRAHRMLNRVHSLLFVAGWKSPPGEAVRRALEAARYRVEGREPPPPIPPVTDEQRERIRRFIAERRAKKGGSS